MTDEKLASQEGEERRWQYGFGEDATAYNAAEQPTASSPEQPAGERVVDTDTVCLVAHTIAEAQKRGRVNSWLLAEKICAKLLAPEQGGREPTTWEVGDRDGEFLYRIELGDSMAGGADPASDGDWPAWVSVLLTRADGSEEQRKYSLAPELYREQGGREQLLEEKLQRVRDHLVYEANSPGGVVAEMDAFLAPEPHQRAPGVEERVARNIEQCCGLVCWECRTFHIREGASWWKDGCPDCGAHGYAIPFLMRESAPDTGWRPIETAPKDGTPILLRVIDENAMGFSGIMFVGSHHDDGLGWRFAAPVGTGGFTDEWIVGWMPLPDPPAEIEREEERLRIALEKRDG